MMICRAHQVLMLSGQRVYHNKKGILQAMHVIVLKQEVFEIH
jgi:hypothetical protein